MREYTIRLQRNNGYKLSAKTYERVFATNLDSAKRIAIDKAISKGFFSENDRSMILATQVIGAKQLV